MREDKDKKLELSNFILFFLFEKKTKTKQNIKKKQGCKQRWYSLQLRGSFNWLRAKQVFTLWSDALFEVSLQSTRMKMK